MVSDLLPDMERIVAKEFLNIIGDPTIAGLLILLTAVFFIVFGSLGFQVGSILLFVLIYVLTAEGYLPTVFYFVMLMALAVTLALFFMKLYRR